MNYCTQCGQKRVEGEGHVCQEIAAAHSGESLVGKSGSNAVSNTIKQVDHHVIYALLKSPQRAASLQPDRDLIYGILGLAASIVGFMIWVWMVGKKLSSLFDDIFGFNSFLEIGSASSKITSILTGKLFGLAMISIVVIVAALWLIGNWTGRRKLTVKELVTYFGGSQYSFGAGFIIAGLGTIISLRVSIILVVINLLAALVMNLMFVSELAEVSRERRLTFVVSSIAVYFILSAILAVIIV
ncbi:hypothetical protein [Paenibacillus kobensis]|uniref:hypothetical protein n=1 Tax=Paenibacillus kobensis TaxID=59841 RepID=UPI000FD95D21|nr:hypothetical protein [Paenibacillus kobensis]